MNSNKKKTVAVIVAHPDDETLWAGGTILMHPLWECFIVCLTRKNDEDRSAKFFKAMQALKSDGVMGDLDDGPEQTPLDETELKIQILELLPLPYFDLILTHNPSGEYSRHIRHEEISKAVINLWYENKILTNKLMMFAFNDHNKNNLPLATENASTQNKLSEDIWLRKYSIITDIYGFQKDSFEESITPHTEAFWDFTDSYNALQWLNNKGVLT